MKTRSSTMLVDHTHGLKFTESPRWHDGKLWFLDIHDQRIKTADLDGRLETALELPFKPNGFGFRRDGSLLVGDALQRQIHRWDGTALQHIADLGDITCLLPERRDRRCRRTGCTWATSATTSGIPRSRPSIPA